MISTDLVSEKQFKLPNFISCILVAISIAPLILNLLGYDFGNQKLSFDSSVTRGIQPNEIIDVE
jgi:hypothetical protein